MGLIHIHAQNCKILRGSWEGYDNIHTTTLTVNPIYIYIYIAPSNSTFAQASKARIAALQSKLKGQDSLAKPDFVPGTFDGG